MNMNGNILHTDPRVFLLSKKNIGYLCILFSAVLMLLSSAAYSQPFINGLTPNNTIESSKTLFSLTGEGFSPTDQIVIWGRPPKTQWQIPAMDPNQVDLAANMTAVRIKNNLAYIVEDSIFMRVLSLNIPDQSQLIATLTDIRFTNLKRIWIAEDFLYLTDSGYGIWVVDISDPSDPFLAGNGQAGFSHYAPSTFGIYVKDSIIFTTNFDRGLQILEQLPTGQIKTRGSYPISGTPYDVVVRGNYAYVALGSTLKIFDISNLDNPIPMSVMDQIPNSPNIQKLFIKEDLLYMADNAYGIWVADLSSPADPNILSGFNLPGPFNDIRLFGNYALIANGLKGLQVIDLHQKKDPSFLGNIYTLGDARSIAFYDYYIYVANGYAGLGIVEAPSLAHPNLLASIATGDNLWAITSRDNYAFVSNGSSGLTVIQTDPPSKPELVQSIPTDQVATYSFVKNNMLYLADTSKFKVYDIADPLNPLLKGSLGPPNIIDTIMSIFVQGDYAYLANFGFGAKSVNIKNPSNMNINIYKYPKESVGFAYDILVDQYIGYIANGLGGLWIVDFQDSSPYTRLSILPQFTYASNLKKYKNLIYMTNGSAGLEIIDVNNPEDPNHIGTINYNDDLKEIDIEAPFLYTAAESQGLWVNYLSREGKVTPMAAINLPDGASTVKSNGDLIYCGDGEGNFHIFTSPALAQILTMNYNSIIFRIDQDLPAGSYDIFLIKESGESFVLPRGLDIYQEKVTFQPGLNILSYPGFVPPENGQAFSLLTNLATQVGGENLKIEKIARIRKSAAEPNHLAYMDLYDQPSGQNFEIVAFKGYPLYAIGTEKKEYLLASHQMNITEDELIETLRDEITPGRNLISMPLLEENTIKSETLLDTNAQPAAASVQEWDAYQGKWLAEYPFFGQMSGKVKYLNSGKGYLVCKP